MTNLMMLFDIAVIVLAAKLAGVVVRKLGQPAVVGEIAVGVLFGALLQSNQVTRVVLSGDVRTALNAVATVGIVLFMFTVGHEWDHRVLRGNGRSAAGIAVGATLLPFLLGGGTAIWLAASQYHPANPVVFVLFVGTAMSITALPVLARIVIDRGLSTTPVGRMAVASAAAVDVAAWVVLAVVVSLASGVSSWHMVLLVPFVLVLVFVARPLLSRALSRWTGNGGFGLLFVGLCLCAAATEWFGTHVVFGAFLFGAILPGRDNPVVRRHVDEVDRFTRGILLPVFFVIAAINVDLSALGTAGILELLLILGVAVAGKVLGAYLGARTFGMERGPARAIAVLMNARGVTELVVLQVGLQIGVLDTRLYSIMVMMALFTTALTGPLLTLLQRRHGPIGRLTSAPLEVEVPAAAHVG
ncbi:cation:proton antiporter [Kutzneria buriramensis]|uniref:Kef-type K+ transport system membrane component KefB n=1 Tax=Kutzneria buriramensis TaxID=1045776 RepID=A0A3E0GVS3_9PSEU|nr:cation:proton antiporter [Kutzneria buriramensis]REH29639.1 Kef-type K+ transport system membrane component KefB [Kutzneria buriramensis]